MGRRPDAILFTPQNTSCVSSDSSSYQGWSLRRPRTTIWETQRLIRNLLLRVAPLGQHQMAQHHLLRHFHYVAIRDTHLILQWPRHRHSLTNNLTWVTHRASCQCPNLPKRYQSVKMPCPWEINAFFIWPTLVCRCGSMVICVLTFASMLHWWNNGRYHDLSRNSCSSR